MKCQIVGKNIEVTDAIENVILEKLEKVGNYFNGEDVSCRVLVRSYKVGAKVEITIFNSEMDLRAEVTDDDLYAAIDLALDKLKGQMRKLKTRLSRSRGKMSFGKAFALDEIEDDEPLVKDEKVRSKVKHLLPMSFEEAVTRMEAIDHRFYLYLDEDDYKITVVYAREDGGYGIFQADNDLKEQY